MSKWLNFEEDEILGHGKKTKVFNVVRKDGSARLGRVGWYGAWRCYAFFPFRDCLFEKHCLRDIADFIESQNKAHKEEVKLRAVG